MILQAELLADLADADRAGLDVGFELLGRALAPARADVAEVDAGEHAEAILVRAGVERRQRAGQPLARHVLGDEHHPQVQRVHHRDDAVDRFGGGERPGWPCTSIAGNFAFGTLCSAVTSVERGR